MDETPRDGEQIEVGPNDRLEESAQDWATLGVTALGLGVGAGKVAVDYARVRLDRERLDFDRQQAQQSELDDRPEPER